MEMMAWMDKSTKAANGGVDDDYKGLENEELIIKGKDASIAVSGLNHAMHQMDGSNDNGYDKNGKKINDKGGDKTDYIYNDDGSIFSSTTVENIIVDGGFHESLRGYGFKLNFKMASGAITEDNSIFEFYVGGKIIGAGLSLLGDGFTAATGGLKQWFRYGSSYSRSLEQPIAKSIRWGASPKYANKIGNQTLRDINQTFREMKLPGNNWRVNDAGHFHLKR
jgi:hypothetical protein